MMQRLQWRQPLHGVHLKYLLHKVDKLKDFESLLFSVLKRNLIQIVNIIVALSIEVISFLTPELLDVPLLKKLPKIQERVVSLGQLDVGLLVRRYRGVHKLLKGFEDKALLILVEDEEPIPVDRLINQVIWR